MDTPAERLRQARIAAGFKTTDEAALSLGVNKNTYRQHENSIRGLPKGRAPLYARRYKVDVEWLLYGSGKGAPEASLDEPAETWPLKRDVMKSILEVALLPFPKARVSADDLPIFAHAVTEAVRYVAADPTRADKPGFRDAVEGIVETAVRNYKPQTGQAA